MTRWQKIEVIDTWRRDEWRTVQSVAQWASRRFGFAVSRDDVRALVEGRER